MRFLPRWLCPWAIFSFLACPALAVPENQFEQEFPKTILPAFWSGFESGTITAPDGMKVHYRKSVKPGQENALVILPGRTESTFKFAEFVYDVQDLNMAVFIIDHRGQGASGRELADSQIQYVQDFSFFREDLGQLVNEVIKPLGFKKIYGMGHSMGANILSLYAVKNPETFQKLITSSPMLDINPAPFPYQWMAYVAATIGCWLGMDKDYVIGHGHFSVNDPYWGTNSMVRFKAFNQLRADKVEEIMGGASYRFAQKAMAATWDMRKEAEKLLAPLLMLQAGNDDVVLTGGQDYVCERAKQCRKITFPEAKHELHIETDSIRDPWLQSIREFLLAP